MRLDLNRSVLRIVIDILFMPHDRLTRNNCLRYAGALPNIILNMKVPLLSSNLSFRGRMHNALKSASVRGEDFSRISLSAHL